MKQAQVLTDKDTKRVLAHVQRNTFAARNRCALQLSWLAGMRVGKIAALSIGGRCAETIRFIHAEFNACFLPGRLSGGDRVTVPGTPAPAAPRRTPR